jgi:hypothetical protein
MTGAGHHHANWFALAKEQVHGSHRALRELGDPFCLVASAGQRGEQRLNMETGQRRGSNDTVTR